MKKVLLAILFVSAGFWAQAQTAVKKSDVPDPVVKAYLSQNSNGGNDTIWEKEIVTIYKVKHREGNRQYESQYHSDGSWIKTYTVIGTDELPVLVVNQLRTSYPEYTISKATIELSGNGKLYAVELRKGKDVIMEYFLMNGKLYR